MTLSARPEPRAIRIPLTAARAQLAWPWLLGAAAVFAANLFLHLPVTDVFDGLAKRLGFRVYERDLVIAFGICGVAACLIVAKRRVRPGLLLVPTLILLTLALVAHRFLMVGTIESIHYPQYALLAFLLGRGGVPAETTWLSATALGGIDELYQYLFLPRGRPTYLDWNDIVLNAIGAAFGIVALLLILRREEPPLHAQPMPATPALSWSLALLTAPLCFVLLHPKSGRGPDYILSPWIALMLIGTLWVGVRLVLQRHQNGSRSR